MVIDELKNNLDSLWNAMWNNGMNSDCVVFEVSNQ